MDRLGGDDRTISVWKDDHGDVFHKAHDYFMRTRLRRGVELQARLAATGFTPTILATGEDWYRETFVESRTLHEHLTAGNEEGRRGPIINGETWRRECARLLWTLRQRRVRHCDLTPPNIFVRNDSPIVIDFHSAEDFDDPNAEPKRTTSDSFIMWNRMQDVGSVQYPADSPRIIRRWLAVMGDLGGNNGIANLEGLSLLDLGCFAGDFCGLAAADGMQAFGVDLGGFNTEYDSLEEAERLWSPMGAIFQKRNLIDVELAGEFDATLVFSTWSYLVKDFGEPRAKDWLAYVMEHSRRLYFENQLAGDGPGPDFFVEDSDVINYLGQFGNVVSLGTFPVTGRDHARTVFRVSREA